MPTTMEKFSNNERRNITTNEKQVHSEHNYMSANTGMLEKAVGDEKGGLALMEILDYTIMKCLDDERTVHRHDVIVVWRQVGRAAILLTSIAVIRSGIRRRTIAEYH